MAITDNQLIRRIQEHVRRGVNAETGEVTQVRQTMFSRYYGEAYGNERDGYSKYVSREVLEAIEWCLPSIMRIFLGGPRAVEFAPSGADDEDQAKHETDVVNYWFFNGGGDDDDESGFLTLYSWVKDFLMYPNGYVKVAVEEITEDESQSYTAIFGPQLDHFNSQPDLDIAIDKKYRSPAGDWLFDVTVTKDVTRRMIQVSPVPPDEVIISHRHTKLNLNSSEFTCHRVRKTRSELIEMGYDKGEIEDVGPDSEGAIWNAEETTMLFYSDEQPMVGDEDFDDPADEELWVHECYMRADVDGDGVSELRKIVMIGTKIFENEPTDYVAIVAASAIAMPHKHIGLSIAECVSDLQELSSTLHRQLLDNIYKQNVRRKYVAEQAMLSDGSTMAALTDGQSEVVPVRGPPAEAVMPEQIQSVVAEIAAVIEQVKTLPQMRTGVAPTLTLDPSVLEKSTMGAFLGALEQASQRLELIARLFAETGFKQVFQKIHYLLRNHFDQPQQVKIAGKWVQAQPSTWKKRSNLSVNVGLGFNNKQVMVGLLTQLLGIQKEAMQIGLIDPAKPVQIYNTLERLIEQANLGHVESFFVDPKSPEYKPPQPQPDAQMILAQAQAQSLAADAKRKDAELAAKTKLEQDKFAADQAKQKEADTFQAVDGANKLEELRLKRLDLESQIALRDAQIQELNARAQKEGIAPQDPTAADEFARVDAKAKGETAPAPAPEPKSDPALSEMAKALTAHAAAMSQNATQPRKLSVTRDAAGNMTGAVEQRGNPPQGSPT